MGPSLSAAKNSDVGIVMSVLWNDPASTELVSIRADRAIPVTPVKNVKFKTTKLYALNCVNVKKHRTVSRDCFAMDATVFKRTPTNERVAVSIAHREFRAIRSPEVASRFNAPQTMSVH